MSETLALIIASLLMVFGVIPVSFGIIALGTNSSEDMSWRLSRQPGPDWLVIVLGVIGLLIAVLFLTSAWLGWPFTIERVST